MGFYASITATKGLAIGPHPLDFIEIRLVNHILGKVIFDIENICCSAGGFFFRLSFLILKLLQGLR